MDDRYLIYKNKNNMDKRKSTKDIFIKKSNNIHNNKYNYLLVDYKKSNQKVKIICNNHGEFEQTPNSHLNGQGCPKCSKYRKNDIFEFINKSNKIHNDKYDYSLVKYKNSQIKIKIICPEHGIFEQRPRNHINSKQGCPVCGGSKKLTIEDFIKRSNKIHNDKYDYSLVKYINEKTKVKIICKIHGEFEQLPIIHLNGSNCPQCSIQKIRKNEEFLTKSKLKYNNKYDYSLTDYKKGNIKIKIICPIHGVFEQKPVLHLKRGCPLCEGNMKLNTEQIIFNFKQIHGNKYDYSLVEYKGDKTKVKIICPVHGEFEQRPNSHKRGEGCPKCRESK